jgi:alkaline phosphatase D
MEPEELVQPGRRLGRRQFLIAGAGAGLSAAGLINHSALARAKAQPVATGGTFAYGVAAGFPSTSGVTLWTRVADLERSAKVDYEVATDQHFKHIVASSRATAQASRDFTVHQPVSGLKPAT